MNDEHGTVGKAGQEGPVKRQTPGMGEPGCVGPEMLAAYVDGLLDAAGHKEVEAHLAACAACRETVAEAAMARDLAGPVAADPRPSAPFLRLASRGRRRWPVVGTLAAAAAVTLAVIIPRLMRPPDPGARPELADLVAAVGEHRPFEPRLTGGFKYGPLAPVYRSGEGPDAGIRPDVVAAAARLELTAVSGSPAKHLAAKAAGFLMLNRPDAAIQVLEQVVVLEPQRAAYWSDLSAAYLVRAQRSGSDPDTARALAAADRALSLAPSLGEAYFNRALALAALGRGADAATAWHAYLALDATSPWAAVARNYLRAGPVR